MNTHNSNFFQISETDDIFNSTGFMLTDEILDKAKIAAYMYGQTLDNAQGEDKPYNPKTFPEKAVDIMIVQDDDNLLEIFLDSATKAWDSRFKVNGEKTKLGPVQMEQFFSSEFYRLMLNALSKKWPLSDPTFKEYFDACVQKKMLIGETKPEDGMLNEIDQPHKRKDLANKDVTGDGKRDYSSTGRRIETFGDMGVKGNSGKYSCWPNPKNPFKWSQWKDWKKISPICKMKFIHDNREYGISLSTFDINEPGNSENRGFRGADYDWEPPLAWLTPNECEQVMKLNIVRKFVRQCIKRILPYLKMPAEEVLKKINKPEKISLEEVRKTQQILKGVVNTVLRNNKADNYCWGE